ncbi:hypothetical protein BC831DRAFT_451687 [Entophlyctis helioformis]|nr:hypothetical protein BC831DRAFT_451687 [Entophlyctis helioformis]
MPRRFESSRTPSCSTSSASVWRSLWTLCVHRFPTGKSGSSDCRPCRICVADIGDRLDYVKHIEGLIGPAADSQASCIYPLIGCKRNPTWHFLALDIDARSIDFARANAHRNGLDGRIRVVQSIDSDPLFHAIADEDTIYDFCLCNPPFYASHEDIQQSRESKADAPRAVCMGQDNEMISQGGEVAFVTKIINESMALQSRVRWFTSLVGIGANATTLEATLRDNNVPIVRRNAYRQGQTTRWILSWSFSPDALPSRGTKRPLPADDADDSEATPSGHTHPQQQQAEGSRQQASVRLLYSVPLVK